MDFYDFEGSAELSTLNTWVGAGPWYNGSCSVRYTAATQQLTLLDNSGNPIGSGTIGQRVNGNTLSIYGSQCILDVTDSSASPVGTTLSLFLSLSFPTAGTYNWFGQAQAVNGVVNGSPSSSLGTVFVTGSGGTL